MALLFLFHFKSTGGMDAHKQDIALENIDLCWSAFTAFLIFARVYEETESHF